jgi:hypothetical protein
VKVDREHRYYKRIMKDLEEGMVIESSLRNFKIHHVYDDRSKRYRNTRLSRYERLSRYLREKYGCPKNISDDIITSYEILINRKKEGWKHSKMSTHPTNFRFF